MFNIIGTTNIDRDTDQIKVRVVNCMYALCIKDTAPTIVRVNYAATG